MDKSQDCKFENISELKWLPFIGDEYLSSKNKILIVGESHYQENNENSKQWNNKSSFTREIHSKIAIEKKYNKTKIFYNLNRALFRNDDRIDTNILWNKLAFYNFVQCSMNTRKSRPNKQDFIDGWLTFFKLTAILKPESCLFIGVRASDFLETVIEKTDYELKSLQKLEKINNTYPRKATLIDPTGKEIKLLFIKHSSQFFSWNEWNNFMRNQYPNELKWLKSGIWLPKNTVGNIG